VKGLALAKTGLERGTREHASQVSVLKRDANPSTSLWGHPSTLLHWVTEAICHQPALHTWTGLFTKVEIEGSFETSALPALDAELTQVMVEVLIH
jgi:hypothetical protein